MKATLIILCLALFGFSVADAQIVKNIGLNAGYIYAKQNWKYNPQTGLSPLGIEAISGFSGGVFVELFDIPYFSVVTKLFYVGKGRTISYMATRIDSTSPNGYVDIGYQKNKQRLDCINIPVLVKFRFGTPIVDPFVALGPRFEYLISHTSSKVYDNFKKTEWTGTISLGTEILFVGFPKFLIEASYNTSLTDSYKSDILTVKDNSIEVLVGVSF